MKDHRIIGTKYTHDSGVALIENGRLRFSTELEKLNNGARYKVLDSINEIELALNKENFSLHNELFEHTDYVIDGAKLGNEFDTNLGRIENFGLDVAGYSFVDFKTRRFDPHYNSFNMPYLSYSHVLGHIIGSYVVSPFAENKEAAFVLVFDGGQPPKLFVVDPRGREKVIQYSANLIDMFGVIYGIMGLYFGPFKDSGIISGRKVHSEKQRYYGGFDVPGKLMAYIGQSEPSELLVSKIKDIYDRLVIEKTDWPNDFVFRGRFEHRLMQEIRKLPEAMQSDPSTVLHSVHQFVSNELVNAVLEKIPAGCNFIFTGGSALNIKWNNDLRATNHFKEMFVPPFPNDSGSAIGAAACAMALEYNCWQLDWSAYCGNSFDVNTSTKGAKTKTAKALGSFLYDNPETPVLVLHGRAEIGPRALGHRSIMMNPSNKMNKRLLNNIKGREQYRPVAPICIEEDAPFLFSPGNPDPYMLFEHQVKDNALEKIPAVVHIDGSARLQTINQEQCKTTYDILLGFKENSGFGCLCNTSANFNGTGFLNDLTSAKRFAKEHGIKFIWTKNLLIEVK